MNRRLLLLSVISSLILSSIAIREVMAKYEQPEYKVLESHENIEIRQYGEQIAVEVVTEGQPKRVLGEGFMILSDYVYGKNIRKRNVDMTDMPEADSDATTAASLYRSENIPKTAPFTAFASSGNKWTTRLFMPSSYSLETLPTPDDKRIKAIEIAPEKFAVLKFSGSGSIESFEKKAIALRKFLAQNKINTIGPELDAYYGPWTVPFLRHNEVMILISQ
jgi:hypothetical protein